MEIKMCTCPNGHYFNADIYARCPECGEGPVGQSAPAGVGVFPKTMDPRLAQDASYGSGAFPKTMDPRQAQEATYGSGAFPKTMDPRQAHEATYGSGAFPKTEAPGQGSSYGSGAFPKTEAPGQGSSYGSGAFPKTEAPGQGSSYGSGAFPKTMAPGQGPGTPFITPTQSAVDLRQGVGSEPVVGWLVCVEGPQRGMDYRLHEGYNYIGREEGDVRIQGDNAVSRHRHAVVAFYSKRNTFHVGPADGRNIIELNDEPLFNNTQMHNYDVITVGNTKLMLVGVCGEHFNWTDGVKHA